MRYLGIDTATRISKIGLGTWQFGAREWGYGEGYAGPVARDIVRRAVDLGVTLFDTAEVYGLGRSERILGEALGERRGSVFLATKLFPVLPLAPVVEQRAVASASRIGTRLLDLYQVHWPNPVVSDGTIMRGMSALQRVAGRRYRIVRHRVRRAEHGLRPFPAGHRAGRGSRHRPGPPEPMNGAGPKAAARYGTWPAAGTGNHSGNRLSLAVLSPVPISFRAAEA